jgi:hypothetical protein
MMRKEKKDYKLGKLTAKTKNSWFVFSLIILVFLPISPTS